MQIFKFSFILARVQIQFDKVAKKNTNNFNVIFIVICVLN